VYCPIDVDVYIALRLEGKFTGSELGTCLARRGKGPSGHSTVRSLSSYGPCRCSVSVALQTWRMRANMTKHTPARRSFNLSLFNYLLGDSWASTHLAVYACSLPGLDRQSFNVSNNLPLCLPLLPVTRHDTRSYEVISVDMRGTASWTYIQCLDGGALVLPFSLLSEPT
jgi:hypothetical protein